MSWWRTLLNLPSKGERWSDQRRPAARRQAAGAEVDGPDWWNKPGSPPAPQRHRAAATATATRPARVTSERTVRPDEYRADPPWTPEPESSFTTWGRRFLRGLVVVVLLLAAVTGVRSWLRPSHQAAPAASVEQTFPKDEARAVATRFATSYLSWNEDDRDARPAAIGLDLATGLDKSAGWNGSGRQSAGTALPGEVRVDPSGVTAQVDVRVFVQSYDKHGREWKPGRTGWQRLGVPVARTATRVVVTGPPTFISDGPVALPPDMPGTGAPDEELTTKTQKDAEAFFDAYATSNAAVAAVTAPGSTITSLNGAVRFDALRDWQVYAGNDDERQATAAVTWAGAGKTTLAQNYTVTLRRTVAADGAERWQVAAIR
jgi:hypothetical protein